MMVVRVWNGEKSNLTSSHHIKCTVVQPVWLLWLKHSLPWKCCAKTLTFFFNISSTNFFVCKLFYVWQKVSLAQGFWWGWQQWQIQVWHKLTAQHQPWICKQKVFLHFYEAQRWVYWKCINISSRAAKCISISL